MSITPKAMSIQEASRLYKEGKLIMADYKVFEVLD